MTDHPLLSSFKEKVAAAMALEAEASGLSREALESLSNRVAESVFRSHKIEPTENTHANEYSHIRLALSKAYAVSRMEFPPRVTARLSIESSDVVGALQQALDTVPLIIEQVKSQPYSSGLVLKLENALSFVEYYRGALPGKLSIFESLLVRHGYTASDDALRVIVGKSTLAEVVAEWITAEEAKTTETKLVGDTSFLDELITLEIMLHAEGE